MQTSEFVLVDGKLELREQEPAPLLPTKMQLKRASGTGKGWVLFGCINGNLGDWFERWFATDAKAMKYAEKRGWVVE